MELFGIKRVEIGTGIRQVVVGSSPLTGAAYWGIPGSDTVLQPVLFLTEQEAESYIPAAMQHVTDKGAYTFSTYTATF